MTLLDLDERRSDGAVVTLLWDRGRDQVVLRYIDIRTGDSFVVDVPNDDALGAFNHPHVYRPQRAAA